jgi:hypothetical protein
MINVKKIAENRFEVTVRQGAATSHTVTVSDEDHQRLTAGHDASKEQLLEAAFRFLLEREPNTSILSSFDILVITRYFPEFEKKIGDYLE